MLVPKGEVIKQNLYPLENQGVFLLFNIFHSLNTTLILHLSHGNIPKESQ